MVTKKSKYKSLSEWHKADPKAYNQASKKGLLNEICETFGWRKKNRWTPESLIADAKNYKSKREWHTQSNVAYETAKIKNVFDTCIAHMGDNFYDDDTLISFANDVENIKDYKARYEKAYEFALENDKIKMIEAFYERKTKWDKEKIFEVAKNFKHIYSFSQKYPSAEKAAIKLGVYEELIDFYNKKEWDDMRDFRILMGYTKTKEFIEGFEKFKEKEKLNPTIL
jgi:hypothetical protein